MACHNKYCLFFALFHSPVVLSREEPSLWIAEMVWKKQKIWFKLLYLHPRKQRQPEMQGSIF